MEAEGTTREKSIYVSLSLKESPNHIMNYSTPNCPKRRLKSQEQIWPSIHKKIKDSNAFLQELQRLIRSRKFRLI